MGLRCLIVDDSKGFLDAARMLLEREGIEIVGVASTSTEALRHAGDLEPDLVLVDISLGEESGFDLARRLAGEPPRERPRVLLISTHPEAEFADLIETSPAIGFLPKSDLSASAIVSKLPADRDGDGPEEG